MCVLILIKYIICESFMKIFNTSEMNDHQLCMKIPKKCNQIKGLAVRSDI